MSKRIILYGAGWCGPCKQLRKFLDINSVDYEYKDVDQQDNQESMLKLTDGKYLIPTLIINEQVFQNPSFAETKKALTD